MPRRVLVVLMGCWLWTMTPGFAEERPFKQLPHDLLRWSLAWVAIPQQMVEVGRAYGPLAALTWGPAKGTAVLVDTTTKELWSAAKQDDRPRRRSREDYAKGVMFRYAF